MRKVQRRCCLNYWVSRERSDPEHTYSLRYKRSTDDASTGWSDRITLTFSGSTAVALTGLDPGTVYDVSVEAEGAEFISQPASEVSYAGTLTVGSDLVTGIGYDSEGWGGIFDPYGSLSTTTFELGGVEYSIVELRVGDIRTPAETGKLFLRFDKPLPDGAEFTLTLGTTEFNSSGAFSYGTYIWEGARTGPSTPRSLWDWTLLPRCVQGRRYAGGARRLHHPHHASDPGLRGGDDGGYRHFLRWV